MYHFTDIAKGLNLKYGLLPEGWKSELTKLKHKGSRNLSWLNLKTVVWFAEDTWEHPVIKDMSIKLKPRPDQKFEMIIDEFVENERKYLRTMDAFVRDYLWELEAITSNMAGPKAKQFIGLSNRQYWFIFEKLLNVHNCIEELSSYFQILSMVDAQPKHPVGRVGYFAEALENYVRMSRRCYGEYLSRFNLGRELFQLLNRKVDSHQLGPGDLIRHLNFKELWVEVSSESKILSATSIDNILIAPVRRFPNYGLFAQNVRKKLPPGHPAIATMDLCVHSVKEYTHYVDSQSKVNAAKEKQLFDKLAIHLQDSQAF